MSRTAEKVLAIISTIFTGISIIIGFIGLSMLKKFVADEALLGEFEKELLADPDFVGDFDMVLMAFDFFEGFGWFIMGLLLISLITTIVGIIFIWNNKNPKLAGTMFLMSGFFAFVLSLTSILLYVAGILCFTRKTPIKSDPTFVDDHYDGTMRPL